MGGGGLGACTLGYLAGIFGGCDVWIVAMMGGGLGGFCADVTGVFLVVKAAGGVSVAGAYGGVLTGTLVSDAGDSCVS